MKGHTQDDWAQALPELRRSGAELHGPCPACGGTDRFRVHADGRAYCRQCCPDGSPASIEALRGIEAAAGLRDAFDETARATPRAARPTPSRRNARPVDARALWAARPAAGRTPALRYLEVRGVDARGGLPCRWLPRATAAPFLPGWRMPTGAAGLLLWPFEGPDGEVLAVQLEALTAHGGRTRPRWRRNAGSVRGLWLRAGEPGGGELAICEGPVDALAVAVAEGGEAWAGGGVANLGPDRAGELAALGRPLALWPDGDRAGRQWAIRMQDALLRAGAACRVRYAIEGKDPASELLESK